MLPPSSEISKELARGSSSAAGNKLTRRFFPVGCYWVLDFVSLAGTCEQTHTYTPGLKEDRAGERGARLLSPAHRLSPACGGHFCPLLLLQSSPVTPDPPWQSALAPTTYLRTHSVPVPFNCLCSLLHSL